MNYLKNGDEYLSNTKNIQLEAFSKNFSSLTKHSKGVWYFEFSHKKGNASYVIGYSSGRFDVSAHPVRKFPKLYAYTTGNTPLNNIPSDGNIEVDLNITTEYDKHIGVGIDIDNHNIFYIYDNILISFHFENSAKEWSIIVRESRSTGCSDTVDIYFERNEFLYDPPFQALPWYSYIKLTCIKKHKNPISLLFYVLISI